MKEERNLLKGKRLLIVDDEPDILETLEDLRDVCDVEMASSFDEAKEFMETRSFDIAILNIMGVNGYELLAMAIEKEVIAVMLTAHALSVEDTIKSFRAGAASYIPKDKISDITTYLNDIIEAREKGKNPWWRWLDRFGSYYRRTFESEWVSYEEFWSKVLEDKFD